MVFKRTGENRKHGREFENDVKMYGIQTIARIWEALEGFENDVKMYGICKCQYKNDPKVENKNVHFPRSIPQLVFP